jgi:DNA-3-methyladenine glycosylase II
MFRRNGDDLLDRWDGRRHLRTLPVPGGSVAYSCTFVGTLRRPLLQVVVEAVEHRAAVEAALRKTFTPRPRLFAELLEQDAVLAPLDQRFAGLAAVRSFDVFASLVRCISAQQINLKWAATIRRRLAESYGSRHEVDGAFVYSLRPAEIAKADPAAIRELQFTVRKAESVIGIARAIVEGRLDPTGLAERTDAEVIEELTALKGVGLWTAEWILARTFGRNSVVAGDLGVRKAVGLAYFEGRMPTEEEVRERTAHWGTSAGFAQALLLHGLAEGYFK